MYYISSYELSIGVLFWTMPYETRPQILPDLDCLFNAVRIPSRSKQVPTIVMCSEDAFESTAESFFGRI
jgi:hypothetical protein